jgi:preprotein translocase subunit SecG
MRKTQFRRIAMTWFIILTVIQAIISALLVTVILMQKSEGGGLGTGGSPTGFMSARGAADFMTRATTVLATLFVGLSVGLATLAVNTTETHKIDTSLNRAALAPDPLAGAQNAPAAPVAATPSAAPASAAPADPLAGAAKK